MSGARSSRGAYAAALVLATLLTALAGPRPAVAGTADRTKPKATIATQDGAVLVGPSDVSGMTLTGTVTDNRRVRSVFLNGFGQQDAVVFGTVFMQFQEAELRCAPGRRSCTWTADVPRGTGDWTLWALATDSSGNARRSATINVTVVTLPGEQR